MKKLSVFLLSILLLSGANAHALQFSAQNTNHVSFDKIKDHIVEVEATIQEIERIIAQVSGCASGNELYDIESDACISPVENDPLTQFHGKVEIPACNGTNEAQFFDGNTWICKTFAYTPSTVVITPVTYTYSWVEGAFGSCVPATCGSRTTSATCVRNDGVVVADTYCTGPKPYSFTPCAVPWNKRFCEEGICVNNGLDGNPVESCP